MDYINNSQYLRLLEKHSPLSKAQPRRKKYKKQLRKKAVKLHTAKTTDPLILEDQRKK